MTQQRLRSLAQRMMVELQQNLLPFWLRLEGRHEVVRDAPKSAVHVSRLLWTLTEVGGVLDDRSCLEQADRTKTFLLQHLVDPLHGGVFWSVTHGGTPLETDKHIYAQAFAIYALSAFFLATEDDGAAAMAKSLFARIEATSRKPAGGYTEAFDRTWFPVPNQRLAPRGDVNTLTANTHLHLMEAYTSLLRFWPDPAVSAALRALIELFLDRFLANDGQYTHQFLNADLQPQPGRISYGHDIELSWLIEAAGDALGDPALSQRIRRVSAALCDYAVAHAQDPDGGWSSDNVLRGRGTRLCWVQAEAIAGLLNSLRRGGPAKMLDRAEATWSYIENVMIDRMDGGWFAAADRADQPDPRHSKIGPWIDPYHQARACLIAASLAPAAPECSRSSR